PERWAKIVALAEAHGGALPADPDNAALEAFLTAQRDKEPTKFADLSLSVVKLLGRGEYVLDRPGQEVEGHFGLALRDYTHSTAPNRRFPDLVTQRLVKAALAGSAAAYSNDELAGLAAHCTELVFERRARRPRGPLHRAGRRREQGRATGAEVRRRAPP